MAFINLNKNIPKYICFVCSEEYLDYEEMKKHIIESHDLGRDYVLCPLKRCSCPVRDIRSHFKAKHPQEILPKCEQYKATVWRDVCKKTNKVKVKKKFKEGHYISKKNNNEKYFYRSGLELEFYVVLEKMPEVLKYKPEPFQIEYFFEGFTHNYIPDILVEYVNGKRELWEIKPKHQINLPKNQAKWSYANNYCKNRNIEFIVYTENGLKELKRKFNHL
jgi:hypothetical protein